MNWLRENALLALAGLGFLAVGLYRALKWLTTAPRTPDPWGAEIAAAVESEDAVPLCQHCLFPQEHNGWFCPECGAAVGPYCNYLPMVYPFSIGESLRAGITGPFRRNWLTLTGYALIAVGFLSILLAPVYLLFLYPRLARPSEELRNEEPAS